MVAGSTKETVINGFSPPSSRHSNFKKKKKSFFSLSRDLGMQLIIENFCEIVICDFGGHDSSSLTFLSEKN